MRSMPLISWLDPTTPLVDGFYYSNNADLVFEAPAAGVTRVYQLYRDTTQIYAGDTAPAVANYQADNAFVEGVYSVRVIDTNAAGVATTFALNFVLDITPPDAPVIALATDSGDEFDGVTRISDLAVVSGTDVQFAIQPNGAGELVWLSLTDMNTLLAARADGVTVLARQSDLTGNMSAETRFSFTIDRTPPATPVVVATGNDEELTVTDDANATETYRYRLVGETEWSTPSPTAPTGLANGLYEIEVTATDAADNTSSVIVSVTVDNPLVPIATLASDTGASATDFITSAQGLTVTPVDGTTAEFSYDAGTTWVTTQRDDLTDGNYYIQVRMVDAMGDASPSVTVAFNLDTIADDLTPAATMTDTEFLAVTTFAGQETDALIEYSTDGGTNWSFDRPTTGLDDGDIITLRQTDRAGNVSGTATITLDVADVVPPIFTIDTPNFEPNSGLF
jgi:large repetitive protein